MSNFSGSHHVATFFIFLSFIKCDNLAHSKHYKYLRYEHSEKHA